MTEESVNLVEYLNKLEKIIELQNSYIELLEDNTTSFWCTDDLKRRDFLKMELFQLKEKD